MPDPKDPGPLHKPDPNKPVPASEPILDQGGSTDTYNSDPGLTDYGVVDPAEEPY